MKRELAIGLVGGALAGGAVGTIVTATYVRSEIARIDKTLDGRFDAVVHRADGNEKSLGDAWAEISKLTPSTAKPADPNDVPMPELPHKTRQLSVQMDGISDVLRKLDARVSKLEGHGGTPPGADWLPTVR